MQVALVLQEKINGMTRIIALIIITGLMASCRSTRNIQSAISKKDSAIVVDVDPDREISSDTLDMIRETLGKLDSNRIEYNSFSAKIKVEYKGGDGRNNDVNAHIRMYKDSVIWININAMLGIDVMRVMITKDSVKLLDKLNKTYTARSVDYLQEVTALPLDLETVQDLIVGNPLYLDSNIVSYSLKNDRVSMLSLGLWFKNLVTLSSPGSVLMHSKLDDADNKRNRTAELNYDGYETKKGFPFSTKRKITVAEKTKLEIQMEFKQYEFNETLSFPFNIPKNYELY
jgi:Domain of unknown function (DUF4292)